MGIDTAVAMAAIGLVLLWPLHQALTIRALRHSLRRQRDQLAQHRRAIVQLQGAATQPPTTIGQPMPTIGRPVQGGWVNAHPRGKENGPELTVTQAGLRSLRANESRPATACTTGTDATLRLARPPALSDIEHVLTQAGRALTATEIATQLGRQPWDLIADIDGAVAAGRIRTVPGHTAGRTAYQLADTDTLRMPHGMPVLPGAISR